MATNPLVPPMDPRAMAALGMPNPFAPPPPPSPSLGFQTWASDPQNAHKVVPAMTGPDQPLQPNAGQQQMASANPPQPPPMASAAPPASVSAPVNLPQAPAPAMPSAPPVVQSQAGADAEKLRQYQTEGAGLNKIHNGFLRNLAKVGDIAGTILAPGVMAAVPGTTVHNWRLQEQQQGRVANDQAALQADMTQRQGAASLAHTDAETAAIPVNAGLKQQHEMAALAQHGLKVQQDENGVTQVVPDEDSPVYQKQQVATQLAQATMELKQAQTAYEKTKADPNSPGFKLAAQRLQIAQQAQDRLTGMMGAMQERATAQMMTATARTLGTDLSGNPLPGAMITDDGHVVGGQNAPNVRPTGQQRGKGNMAESADQQIDDMKSIVAKRADIFGPAAGRKTDFNVWLGSQDPDAQRFRAARTIAGDHLAGTFGGRSEAALNALDAAIGQFKDNPAAVNAGLDQLKEANTLFKVAGKVKTVGGKDNPMQPPTQAAPKAYKQTATSGNHKIGSNDGGNTWYDVQTGKKVQ